MKYGRFGGMLAILLITISAVVVLVIMTQNIADSQIKSSEGNRMTELALEFVGHDVTVYWIGEFPRDLDQIRSKVVFPDPISEDTMPVKSPEFHTREFDQDGELVAERTPVEQTKYNFIVINNMMLSNDDLVTVRSCFAENGVGVLVLGKNAIDRFRDFYMLTPAVFKDHDSMYHTLAGGSVNHALGDDYTSADILEYLNRQMNVNDQTIGETVQDGN